MSSSINDELENEWIEEIDDNHRFLWKHKFTNEIINKKPSKFMETQFIELFSLKHQRRYWINKVSGLIKWEIIDTLPMSKQNEFILNNPKNFPFERNNNSNQESFCWSIVLGDLENVKRLYESNNNVINARYGSNKSTPLIIAVENNKVDIVKYIISLDININLQDINGNTGLHQSIISGYLNITVLLIRKGSNIYIKNKDNKIAFDYTTNNYQKEYIEQEMPSISSGIKWLIHGESTVPHTSVPKIESILIDDYIEKKLSNSSCWQDHNMDDKNNQSDSKIDNNNNNNKESKCQHQLLTESIKQRTEERIQLVQNIKVLDDNTCTPS